MTDFKIYKTHHNHDRPYTVVVIKDLVKIYKNSYDGFFRKRDKKFKPKLLHILIPKQIWIGKSCENKMTKFSGRFGDKFDGNTVLLHLGKSLYMFISYSIKYFQLTEKIEEFYSPVGNNDIPYPWMKTPTGYIIIENNGNLTKLLIQNKEDKILTSLDCPYDHHWNINLEKDDKRIKLKPFELRDIDDDIKYGNWNMEDFDDEGFFKKSSDEDEDCIEVTIPKGTCSCDCSSE